MTSLSPANAPLDSMGRIAQAVEMEELIARLPAELREQALTHYTWVEDERDSCKRLAHMGDSALALFVAEDLHRRLPDCHPGTLTLVRSRAVSGAAIAAVGRELGIPKMLEAREESKRARAISTEILVEATRPIAEMTEAMIGASYLTFGFDPTRSAVLAAFEEQIQAGVENPIDPKSMLQRLLSRRRKRAKYEVTSRSGSKWAPKFAVAAVVDSKRIGEGEGRSKREAEHAAAQCALDQLGASPSQEPDGDAGAPSS